MFSMHDCMHRPGQIDSVADRALRVRPMGGDQGHADFFLETLFSACPLLSGRAWIAAIPVGLTHKRLGFKRTLTGADLPTSWGRSSRLGTSSAMRRTGRPTRTRNKESA